MRLVFAGTPEFAERSLAALHSAGHDVGLVLTQPDRPVGRGLKVSASPVKSFALAQGLAVFQPATLRNPEVLERIAGCRPDALVVAAYGLILPDEVLRVAPLGAINVHASLLPRWRGAAPIQRALLAGDPQTGISIMQMDRGLDTGPVLRAESLPIRAEDDTGTLHDRLAKLGAQLIVATLADLAAGVVNALPQPDAGATYAAKIRKEDTLLDWRRPARELERVVRAFRPAPGAQARHGGDALKVWRAELADEKGSPGEVLSASAAGITVACGEGALLMRELQRPGGRRMSAAEYLRGHPVQPGAFLE